MDSTASLSAQIISSFEGCNLAPYRCPAGRWSIGFGNTVLLNGQPVTDSTPPITTANAHALLVQSIDRLYAALKNRVLVPLAPYEWAALISLSYNIGLSAFNGSTLLKRLNQSDFKGAAEAFLSWNKAHVPKRGVVVVPGLARRREKERAVFLGYPFRP